MTNDKPILFPNVPAGTTITHVSVVDSSGNEYSGELTKPLTNEQIKAGRTEGYDAEDTPDAWDFEQGVRFAERHHGIGEKR